MKCDKCEKEAIAEIETGFRSLKVKTPLCGKHLKERSVEMAKFREIFNVLTGA